MTTTLRIDEELYEEVVKLAQQDKRSINSEILFILQKYVDEQEKKTND